ncbi:PHO85 cyclin-1 [Emydomyces testavorans]|uniref:PHO85 cyclin-1 n=1 Tax=Emydomyces testavorans TaxID=2070801 RepID=A0AAF0DIR2_9EURO|nr:PHO85 cyclin-1 [Emydomyces testavorans]
MPVVMSEPSYDAEALNEFIMLPVSSDMILYLAQKASQVLRCEDDIMPSTYRHAQPPTPPESPILDDAGAHQPPLPSVAAFIRSIVKRSHVEVPTLMTSLVFLARLRAKLPPMSKGMRCTPHRIFLASLILAAKNLNDSSPKNKHWSRYTFVDDFEGFGFSLLEVNLMERQLLALLDWDTRVKEDDLFEHFEPFLAPIRDRLKLQDELEAARENEWQLQASLVHKSHSRSASSPSNDRMLSGGVYDSPGSISGQTSARVLHHTRRRSLYSGGRSISPPSLRDVPGLYYEASIPSSSSRSSSIAPSSRGTPASFSTHSTTDIMIDDGKHSPSMMSGYVTIQHLRPKAKAHPSSTPSDLQQHPKRAKMVGTTANGNLFSRFFNSAANSYAEKRMARAAARG